MNGIKPVVSMLGLKVQNLGIWEAFGQKGV